MSDSITEYINTIDYSKLENKIYDLCSVMDELKSKCEAARKLRYGEVDIESERNSGKLAPDELFIPQHIIETNIRREQAAYVQYVVQSPRAVILQSKDNPPAETQILEKDVTSRLRFDGFQLSMFSNIDGFQQNGYGIMEIVQDQNKSGEIAHEYVQYGDFGLLNDSRDVQEQEIICRNYYFSRTKLLSLVNENDGFIAAEINNIIDSEPDQNEENVGDNKNKSLFKVEKLMFRINGIVHTAWACEKKCDNWIRLPRPLTLGRRELIKDPTTNQPIPDPNGNGMPLTQEVPERDYPYFLFPYLISENSTISRLKGRAYLDQDTQDAVTSLVSSVCTSYRRGSGLYFSKDTSDPNDDVLQKKNVYFEQGALINAKVTQFQLKVPDPSIFQAIQMLVTSNQQETSQINFAAQNRRDSRKTATEIQAASATQQQLSTVQVVLFSNALRNLYTAMFMIIRSRVLAGLIQVTPDVKPLYSGNYNIKPSGDVDVIERQQMIQQMTMAWQIMQNTPANIAFLSDMLIKMFPNDAPRYIQIFQQAQQQQQSQQAQQMNQLMGVAKQMGAGIIKLADHPEMFSDTGKIHAFPVVQQAAEQLESLQQQLQPPQQAKAQ